MDAVTVGRASLALGAGRSRADDEIDFSVGFDQLAKVGEMVEAGSIIGRVHAANELAAEEAAAKLLEAFRCDS